MFKLKKILNKHNNAPELEFQNVSYESYGRRERVYVLENGMLTHNPYNDEGKIYYLANGTVDDFDIDRAISCFRITPDMIFEVDLSAAYPPAVGDKFALQSHEERVGYDSVIRVEQDQASDGFFVNTDEWHKTKKALVRFHCNQ